MANKSSVKSKNNNENLPLILTNTPAVLIVVSLIIFTVVGIAWWNNIYLRPRNVFEDMLKNNLATKSVTKQTETTNGASIMNETKQVSFVPEMASRSVLKITQPGTDGETEVITESIGTLKTDYSQYLQIDTAEKGEDNKALDYSNVLNTWGRSNPATSPQNFQQSILGLVPFANIRSDQRLAIVKKLINEQAYVVDYAGVQPKEIDGYSALVFPVSIDSAKYLSVLIELAKMAGYADLSGLDPSQYQDTPPIEVDMIVDKRSRKLLEVDFKGSDQKEVYSSYGLSMPIQPPENSIAIEELQQKIQEVR